MSAFKYTNLWHWFGLSYSSYMVLPRAILCDMPQDVQQKMLDVLDYISANYDTDKLPGEYSVRARSNGKFISDPLSDYRHCPIDQYRKSSVEIVE